MKGGYDGGGPPQQQCRPTVEVPAVVEPYAPASAVAHAHDVQAQSAGNGKKVRSNVASAAAAVAYPEMTGGGGGPRPSEPLNYGGPQQQPQVTYHYVEPNEGGSVAPPTYIPKIAVGERVGVSTEGPPASMGAGPGSQEGGQHGHIDPPTGGASLDDPQSPGESTTTIDIDTVEHPDGSRTVTTTKRTRQADGGVMEEITETSIPAGMPVPAQGGMGMGQQQYAQQQQQQFQQQQYAQQQQQQFQQQQYAQQQQQQFQQQQYAQQQQQQQGQGGYGQVYQQYSNPPSSQQQQGYPPNYAHNNSFEASGSEIGGSSAVSGQTGQSTQTPGIIYHPGGAPQQQQQQQQDAFQDEVVYKPGQQQQGQQGQQDQQQQQQGLGGGDKPPVPPKRGCCSDKKSKTFFLVSVAVMLVGGVGAALGVVLGGKKGSDDGTSSAGSGGGSGEDPNGGGGGTSSMSSIDFGDFNFGGSNPLAGSDDGGAGGSEGNMGDANLIEGEVSQCAVRNDGQSMCTEISGLDLELCGDTDDFGLQCSFWFSSSNSGGGGGEDQCCESCSMCPSGCSTPVAYDCSNVMALLPVATCGVCEDDDPGSGGNNQGANSGTGGGNATNAGEGDPDPGDSVCAKSLGGSTSCGSTGEGVDELDFCFEFNTASTQCNFWFMDMDNGEDACCRGCTVCPPGSGTQYGLDCGNLGTGTDGDELVFECGWGDDSN